MTTLGSLGGNPLINTKLTDSASQRRAKIQELQTAVRNLVGSKNFYMNSGTYVKICTSLATYEGVTPQHVLDIAESMKNNSQNNSDDFKSLTMLDNCLKEWPHVNADDFKNLYSFLTRNFSSLNEDIIGRFASTYMVDHHREEYLEDSYNAVRDMDNKPTEETETEPEAPSVPTTGTTMGPKVGTPLGEGAGGFTKAPVSGSDILADQNKLLVGGTSIGITKNAGSDDEEQRLLAMGFNHVFGSDKAMKRSLRHVKEGDMVVVPGEGAIDGFPYIAYKMQNGKLVEITDIFEVQRNFNHQ